MRLVKIFDIKQTKASLIELEKNENEKPLHELERYFLKNPLQIFVEGDTKFCNTLSEAGSPLHGEISSQEEFMEIPLSKEDQDPRSLVDNELLSNFDEKEKQEDSSNVVTSKEDPLPRGDGDEVIVSKERDCVSLQVIPK